MSMADKNWERHPLEEWLETHRMSRSQASAKLGRSQACVSRWIRGERFPSPVDQEHIAELTKDAVPVAVWHQQALRAA